MHFDPYLISKLIGTMEWLELKKKGNQHYDSQNFHSSVSAYSEALVKCMDEKQKSILLKNRAAAYLKIKNFKLALEDCDAALRFSPGDIKALYRRSQALEGEGQLAEALQSIKMVLVIDASNKEGVAYARRLTETIRRQAELSSSTSEKVKDMFTALNSHDVNDSLKIQAAHNFAILSRQLSGRKELLDNGGLSKLVSMLEHPLKGVVHHILQMFVGLCSSGSDMTVDIMQALTLDKLAGMVKDKDEEISSSAVALLSAVASSLTNASNSLAGELRIATVQQMVALLVNMQVGGSARDALLQAITASLPQVSLQIAIHCVILERVSALLYMEII